MAFHVVKENDYFYLSDVQGNIPESEQNSFGYGLYTQDTRILSRFVFAVHPNVLVPLDSDLSQNYKGVYRYTNREHVVDGHLQLPLETLLVRREQLVDGSTFYEEVTVQNFAEQPIEIEVSYQLDADFRDLFQVRGFADMKGLVTRSLRIEENMARFTYVAKDELTSHVFVKGILVNGEDHAEPFAVSDQQNFLSIRKTITIEPHGKRRYVLAVSFQKDTENVLETLAAAKVAISNSYQEWNKQAPQISGSDALQTWYQRGLLDIRMLLTDIGHGQFPVAGVPWFAVPFGRDSLITAIQLLSAHPEVAKGTLKTMAAYQGTEMNTWRDEQPGKIMHELRYGEVTRTNELPFGPYYGTIDATALFLILAAEYLAWTGDTTFLHEMLPHVVRAFDWIETYGDRDGDGFIEYFQESSKGLANQGWKDSGKSNVHKDGSQATGPIALSEVQAYTYRAYKQWADIYRSLGRTEAGTQLMQKAEHLQQRFLEAFWMEEENAVALALDGEKRQVASVSSNAGQVLWGGILPKAYADRLIDRLMQSDMFNGFGIRTLSANEVGYNPMSYHNGSIWAHDNSLILSGFQRYGRTDAVMRLTNGLLETAGHFPFMRLPELFTGFGKDETHKPIPYPVSCSPQAWAAGTPVLTLQSLLGVQPDVIAGTLSFHPVLPEGVDHLTITGLPVGAGVIDVALQKTTGGHTSLCIMQNSTGLQVILK